MLVAVSKGMQAVKLCTIKILQFLTGGAAYRRVYDSHHLLADCQEPASLHQLQNPMLGNRV